MRDRLWYVVAWCKGVVMCLGLLLFVDWLRIQEWWAEHTISLAGEQPRAHERQVHRLAG